jgi:hypothetical protein
METITHWRRPASGEECDEEGAATADGGQTDTHAADQIEGEAEQQQVASGGDLEKRQPSATGPPPELGTSASDDEQPAEKHDQAAAGDGSNSAGPAAADDPDAAAGGPCGADVEPPTMPAPAASTGPKQELLLFLEQVPEQLDGCR